MATHRTRQILAVLLGTLFVFGVGSETYGWHDCPHHHRDAPPSTAADPAPGPHPVAQNADDLPSPSTGPCTCVGSCHAGATAPLPSIVTPAPDLEAAARAAVAPRPSGFIAHRVHPYFLPYPNGPPLPARGIVIV